MFTFSAYEDVDADYESMPLPSDNVQPSNKGGPNTYLKFLNT